MNRSEGPSGARHRLSLAPTTINDVGPLALIDAAVASGFEAVSLRMLVAPAADPIPQIVGDSGMIEAIEQRRKAAGIKIFSATAIWLHPAFVAADCLPALETAAHLGVEQFLAVGNDPDGARLCDNLAKTALMASAFGLKIALEFFPNSHVRSLTEARSLVSSAGEPNIRIVIDALHLARSGGTPADVVHLAPELIGYLQLCDAPLDRPNTMSLRDEALSGRLYPGEGDLPLAALIAAAPPGIDIDVEMPVARDRHLPPTERARRAGIAIRRFLANLG